MVKGKKMFIISDARAEIDNSSDYTLRQVKVF